MTAENKGRGPNAPGTEAEHAIPSAHQQGAPGRPGLCSVET